MKLLPILVLAFPNACFAMGPDYVGIGSLFLFGLGALFLLFAGIGASIAQNRAKGALVGVGICGVVLFAIWTSMSKQALNYNHGITDMVADKNRVADLADVHLGRLCQTDESFVVNRTIPLGSSIFINVMPDQKPPTASNPPPAVNTPAMEEQQRKYGNSFPPMGNGQYLDLIDWVKKAKRPYDVAEIVKSDLIDTREGYEINGKLISRLATKQRWEKDGMSEIAIAHTEKYSDQYKFINWPESKFVQEIRVDRPSAQYTFTVDDISTLEDRENWVARGRIRLIETISKSVIAEYTGFQALLRPSVVCPNAMKAAKTQKGEWDMLGFFFNRVVEKVVSEQPIASSGK